MADALNDFYVPNWLPDVLEWIKRAEMANSSLSTSSRAFQQLCYPKLHGKVRPRMVPRLGLWKNNEDASKIIMVRENVYREEPPHNTSPIAIAEVPPPEYILGFKQIYLTYLDARTLRFVEMVIAHRPNYRVTIVYNTMWDKFTRMFLPILHVNLVDFNRVMPSLLAGALTLGMKSNGSDKNLLAKWLKTRRADGRPKQLYIKFDTAHEQAEFVKCVKKQFIGSHQPSLFWIFLCFDPQIKMPIKNEATNELLLSSFNLSKGHNPKPYEYSLVRCPMEYYSHKGKGRNKIEHLAYKFMDMDKKTLDMQTEIHVQILERGNIGEYGGPSTVGSSIKKFGTNIAQGTGSLIGSIFMFSFRRILPRNANFHSTM